MSAKGKTRKVRAGRRSLEVKRTGKKLFPGTGITKGDLVEYYQKIAPRMLPYIQGRPAVLQSFPDGIRKSGFYQKNVPDYYPKWMKRTTVRLRKGGKDDYLEIRKEADLVYLADKAVITIHTWLSTSKKKEKPDRLVFDLDPPKKGAGKDVVFAARRLRNALEKRKLRPFVMLTGSKGLHVVVPLRPKNSFDELRKFARETARELAEAFPEKFTVETSIKKRRGRVFLDYLRNAYGQTTVAPYSVRPLPGAPVACPVDWDELGGKFNAGKYTLKTIFRRLKSRKKDPWHDFRKSAASLP